MTVLSGVPIFSSAWGMAPAGLMGCPTGIECPFAMCTLLAWHGARKCQPVVGSACGRRANGGVWYLQKVLVVNK